MCKYRCKLILCFRYWIWYDLEIFKLELITWEHWMKCHTSNQLCNLYLNYFVFVWKLPFKVRFLRDMWIISLQVYHLTKSMYLLLLTVNNFHTKLQFTVDKETNNWISFLDLLLIKNWRSLKQIGTTNQILYKVLE